MFTLRPAQQSDFPFIRSLIYQVQINPLGLSWPRFIVAINQEGAVIGCGQIKPHRDGSRELASIAVVPAQRRQGVARAIIEHLIAAEARRDLAGETGKPGSSANTGDLYLTCRASLGEFYQQFGFQTVSALEMPPYFRRLSRLARLFERLGFARETMLVMRRGGLNRQPA